MEQLFRFAVVLTATIGLICESAIAQSDITSDALIGVLGKKETRGGKASDVMDPRVKETLRELPTRGFPSLKQRDKLAEQTIGLPQVDLEIYFDLGSAELTPQALRAIHEIGVALTDERLAPYSFLIAGHTDAQGDRLTNQSLSERRAAATKNLLVTAYRIADHRLHVVGYGFDRLKNRLDPLADQNRRVNLLRLGR